MFQIKLQTKPTHTFYVQPLLSEIRDNYDIMWENMVDDNMGHALAPCVTKAKHAHYI
jgi:hypothetical protein